MEIKIVECTEPTELYCHYDGQNGPQPTYIEFNPETGEARASYNSDIGSAVPMDVWHKKRFRWPMSDVFTAKAANQIMETIKPQLSALGESWSEKWDGNNYVGEYDTDLEYDVEQAIDEAQDEQRDTEGAMVEYLPASVYFDDVEVKADTDIDALEKQLEGELEPNYVIEDIREWLEEMKQEAIDKAGLKYYLAPRSWNASDWREVYAEDELPSEYGDVDECEYIGQFTSAEDATKEAKQNPEWAEDIH